jgi:hypothetical protein
MVVQASWFVCFLVGFLRNSRTCRSCHGVFPATWQWCMRLAAWAGQPPSSNEAGLVDDLCASVGSLQLGADVSTLGVVDAVTASLAAVKLTVLPETPPTRSRLAVVSNSPGPSPIRAIEKPTPHSVAKLKSLLVWALLRL